MSEDQPTPPLGWFYYLVGLIVTAIFVAACVVDFLGGPKTPMSLYGLMGIIVGSLFGRSALKAR